MASSRNLSIIIPVFNEIRTIRAALQKVLLQQTGQWQKEIIVIDDGSNDGTSQEIMRMGEGIVVIRHEQNWGQGRALRTGLAHARGEVVVFHDADLEYDPSDWPRMLEVFERGAAPVVYGSRTKGATRRGYLHYVIGARLLTEAFNVLWRATLSDLYTGAKMFRRELVEGVVFQEDGFAFQVELTSCFLRKRTPIVEVAIDYSPRTFAEGKKITIWDGLQGLYALMRYR
ncbi:MAG: glycosyltransferase family 2 protein [bacterium]